jgi:antitoxin component YwqK of YwqJK toxin-antitoxin module
MTTIKYKTDAAMPVTLPHYDAQGVLQDIVAVDENGAVTSVTEFYADKSVKATYEMKERHEEWRVSSRSIRMAKSMSTDSYVADKKNGRYTKNHPNGALWIEQTFMNGKLHGKVCYYDAQTGRHDLAHASASRMCCTDLYESFDAQGRRQSSVNYRGGNETEVNIAPAQEAVLF